MELKNVKLSELSSAAGLRSGEDKDLAELIVSIKTKGILCPLVVGKHADKYAVIDGGRRLEALKLAGYKADSEIPVLVVTEEKAADVERALVANAVRSELDAWDLAESLNILAKNHDRKPAELASALGKTDRYIHALLSLFSLPKPILKALRARSITPAHGRCLLKLNDQSKLRNEAFNQALENDLSVRDLEILIGSMLDEEGGETDCAPIFKPIVYDTDAGSRVRLEPRRSSIRIEINLKTDEDIESIAKGLKDKIDGLAAVKVTSLTFSSRAPERI